MIQFIQCVCIITLKCQYNEIINDTIFENWLNHLMLKTEMNVIKKNYKCEIKFYYKLKINCIKFSKYKQNIIVMIQLIFRFRFILTFKWFLIFMTFDLLENFKDNLWYKFRKLNKWFDLFMNFKNNHFEWWMWNSLTKFWKLTRFIINYQVFSFEL